MKSSRPGSGPSGSLAGGGDGAALPSRVTQSTTAGATRGRRRPKAAATAALVLHDHDLPRSAGRRPPPRGSRSTARPRRRCSTARAGRSSASGTTRCRRWRRTPPAPGAPPGDPRQARRVRTTAAGEPTPSLDGTKGAKLRRRSAPPAAGATARRSRRARLRDGRSRRVEVRAEGRGERRGPVGLGPPPEGGRLGPPRRIRLARARPVKGEGIGEEQLEVGHRGPVRAGAADGAAGRSRGAGSGRPNGPAAMLPTSTAAATKGLPTIMRPGWPETGPTRQRRRWRLPLVRRD